MTLSEISIGDFVEEEKQGKVRYGRVRSIEPNEPKNKVQIDYPNGETMHVNPNRLFKIKSEEIINNLKKEYTW